MTDLPEFSKFIEAHLSDTTLALRYALEIVLKAAVSNRSRRRRARRVARFCLPIARWIQQLWFPQQRPTTPPSLTSARLIWPVNGKSLSKMPGGS